MDVIKKMNEVTIEMKNKDLVKVYLGYLLQSTTNFKILWIS